jgi:hypothetical protein
MAGNRWRTEIAKAIAHTAVQQALLDAAEAILTDSQDEVPHDTGTLERSGTVTDAPGEGAVYISYNTPYAKRQHEDLNLHHEAGRKAKYLEGPLNKNVSKAIRLVELRVKKALRDAK